MYSYPSRSEKRQIQLYQSAEKWLFSLSNVILYSSEIKKLKKQGFSVTAEPYYISENITLYIATIDWFHAYGDGMPHIIYSYCKHIIDTYPQNLVNTFAQQLYVTAQRINTQ